MCDTEPKNVGKPPRWLTHIPKSPQSTDVSRWGENKHMWYNVELQGADSTFHIAL